MGMCMAQAATITRTYLIIGCMDRLLWRVLARPSLYSYVLSRGSLRAFAYSAASLDSEIGSRASVPAVDAQL